jgi:hypothetical protein
MPAPPFMPAPPPTIDWLALLAATLGNVGAGIARAGAAGQPWQAGIAPGLAAVLQSNPYLRRPPVISPPPVFRSTR